MTKVFKSQEAKVEAYERALDQFARAWMTRPANAGEMPARRHASDYMTKAIGELFKNACYIRDIEVKDEST